MAHQQNGLTHDQKHRHAEATEKGVDHQSLHRFRLPAHHDNDVAELSILGTVRGHHGRDSGATPNRSPVLVLPSSPDTAQSCSALVVAIDVAVPTARIRKVMPATKR